MTKPDRETIESICRAEVSGLHDVGNKCGITKEAIRKRAKKLDWVHKASMQVRKNGMQGGTQRNKMRTSGRPANAGHTQGST